MRRARAAFFATILFVPAVLHAQATPPSNPVTASLRREWQNIGNYILKAAEQMSEENYAFQPTPQVRTFGQLIGHLAGSQNIICASALGETSTAAEDDIEKNVKAKSALVAAFRASMDLCTRAYNQADSGLNAPTKMFGADVTRMIALVHNTVHNGEHYGNIVTYMRIKGMVPPSSQPQSQ